MTNAEELLATAERQLDGLYILVNKAAMHTEVVPIAQATEVDFGRVMAINAKSVSLAVRYAARHMRGGGRIVNTFSRNTVFPAPGNAPYVAGKGALGQLTLVASRELDVRGNTVNTVSPGATDTDLLVGGCAGAPADQPQHQPADPSELLGGSSGHPPVTQSTPVARWQSLDRVHLDPWTPGLRELDLWHKLMA
ncbi:MAG TPA: SDR family NAD(P)-dependent oxidoreductase [Streptomyces sp.]